MSNTTHIRAMSFPGQRAVDTWESEGGSLATRERGYDVAPALADNAGWLASNNVGWRANDPPRTPKEADAVAIAVALADNDEEDHILRRLGAAVIMRWNTIPRKLQKELFEDASSMGELLQADAQKGQIARFLHKHKDNAG